MMSSKNDENNPALGKKLAPQAVSLIDSGGGLSSAKAVCDEVFDSYRRSRHFSLKRKKPQLYDNILKEVKKMPLPIVTEALNVYIDVEKEDGKRPHPNYFLAICRRLKKEFGNDNVWGKTI